MIVEFISVFDFAGALAAAFRFEFAFASLAFELQIVELIELIAVLLTIPPNWFIVVSFLLGRKEIVASFGFRERPPRKPPDRFGRSISTRPLSVDC